MNPGISVIIPIYNTKLYLQEAVNSILQQSEFLTEIIIIDDGSTDGSWELLENIYGKNEFVKIHHTENKGQGHARNLGTDFAKGDYIYYFDSDDISAPNLFKRFHDLLSQIPDLELFCFSGESFLDPNSSAENIPGKHELSKRAWKRTIEQYYSSGEEAFNSLKDNNSFLPGPPLYIFKKSILVKNGIKFSHIRYEDEEFTHKLFIYAGQTYVTKDVLFYRRVREGSTMQLGRTFKDILGYIKTIENLEELMNITYLKPKTKEHLKDKIVHLVRSIIITKASSNMRLAKEEKRIYKNSLMPYIRNNRNLLLFYYTYQYEYKLRMLKERMFN